MTSPKTIKQVQDLTGRVTSLGRFMARSAERCLPFFKAIRKAKNFLSITEAAVSTVLFREEDGVQKPIYYISKVLQDVETRYPKIAKIALALIISARRLRPYFQSHTIIVLTDQPLRKSIELGEFDIEYKPRTTIKAEALADFIVECTLPEEPPQLVISAALHPWNLYVDGSSTLGCSGAGLILISPEGFTIEYALRFGFQASNNKAEYEALLVGIRLAHALKVDSLSIHSDSQLVVNHVLGDYEARDEIMAQYLSLVKTLAVKFQNFTIRQIPRDQNTQAYTLSRLASAEETDVGYFGGYSSTDVNIGKEPNRDNNMLSFSFSYTLLVPFKDV
ncbi:hypothetical protein RJ639_015494 [Escallonia herrerae]|uniref:RNase H type-1 domain-containing protein n=1 Tax=Escallonia herrerae TaxID=1293975 RepID=A0AA89AMR2_9ASTE|nr:hypothetical protein RJ639_015494 [Escallonia herrerae]